MNTEWWTVPVATDTTTALVQRWEGNSGVVVILGHGASTNMEHRHMELLASAIGAAGANVVRFNFLYAEQKRSPPDRMPKLMECFRAVIDHVRTNLEPPTLIIGGHSMGGRAASHLAADGDACDGLLLLSYPLHPADQPQKLRREHLPAIRVPVLCLNGTRDALCERPLMETTLAPLTIDWAMHWLEGADHGYHVQKRSGRTESDVMDEVTSATRRWLDCLA